MEARVHPGAAEIVIARLQERCELLQAECSQREEDIWQCQMVLAVPLLYSTPSTPFISAALMTLSAQKGLIHSCCVLLQVNASQSTATA